MDPTSLKTNNQETGPTNGKGKGRDQKFLFLVLLSICHHLFCSNLLYYNIFYGSIQSLVELVHCFWLGMNESKRFLSLKAGTEVIVLTSHILYCTDMNMRSHNRPISCQLVEETAKLCIAKEQNPLNMYEQPI